MLWGKAMGYRIEKESELVFVLREGTKGGGGGGGETNCFLCF